MNDNSFGAMLCFAGMFFLMAFDFVIGSYNSTMPNIAFLVPMIFMLIIGSYCSVKWIIANSNKFPDVVCDDCGEKAITCESIYYCNKHGKLPL